MTEQTPAWVRVFQRLGLVEVGDSVPEPDLEIVEAVEAEEE